MIKTYDVCVIFDASRNVVVEARSALEAVELAEDEVEGLQRLCNYCSGNLDTGDVIGSHVWLGDEITRHYSCRRFRSPTKHCKHTHC